MAQAQRSATQTGAEMHLVRMLLAVFLLVFLATTTVAFDGAVSVSAHEPGTWSKTDGVNEITPALTEGTATLDDDEASEFVHEIQWAETPLEESTWRTQADDDSSGDPGHGTIEVAEALAWVYGNISYVEDLANYLVADAWANPEQTLSEDGGSGDCEDLAFLLASLLQWHTDEVNIGEGDLVYAKCGFVLPPDGGFHAWVFWYDASADDWHQLDPTSGDMNHILDPPALGTLWLNDHHVLGFLPGYYPGPLLPIPGYDRDDFTRIAEGGFGDPMNNYAWSMTYFNGDLYVGTGRNITYMVGQALKRAGIIPEEFEFPYITHPGGDIGSLERAEDMRGEIWRYHHGWWERVYQSAVVDVSANFPLPEGTMFSPREPGFRQMVVFEGAIYAASGGGAGPFSTGSLLLKSTDGTTWKQVITPPEMGSDSRSMAVHNGKLYVGGGPRGTATVWGSDQPLTVDDPPSPPPYNWELVADFTLGDPANSGVLSLESFNGYLYAGTQNVVSGYEVFRSDAQSPNHPSLGAWTLIVENGAGDMMNKWGSTMVVFKDRLYVGSSSLPFTADPPGLAPPKGFELIRIDIDDSWELIIGDYFPRDPHPDDPGFRLPRSGWPGGFGNFLNFYCWSLEEDNGVLYLGTFDASSFLRFLPIAELVELPELQDFIAFIEDQREQIVAALEQVIGLLEELGVDEDYIESFERLLAAFQSEPIDWEEVWQVLTFYFTGADLWKTEDGIRWQPVTLNGFNNPDNYGLRNMLHVNPLFIGTANPFAGLEILKFARIPRAVGGIVEPVDPLELGATSGQPSGGTTTHTSVALWIGLVLISALAIGGGVLALRRRRAH